MAALSLIALALATAPAADGVWRWSAEIDAAAARCGVPAEWIARVMRAESGGQTLLAGRPIRSRKGAIGLMQLMPGTWAELRRDLALGDDPDVPADNIVAGACYLRRMYDRFGYPGLFGAYNAGPARYAAWLAGETRLPGETAAYLRAVGAPAPAAPVAPSAPRDPMFVVRRDTPAAAAEASPPATAASLFALRREVP
ncbi:soluble lytic murein transglycosylase-like protein [Sphingomonas naasensis]|uniref:Lytic transglycosylase domain-containing protein n=1 Tax=Sphingomonas naasensis TaxID=1344951 RepID=A0A4S1W6E3_9SPHN|nr:lytic transglycosylase domain-containing protein [Sphingomonas naasensis]NIJ21136.1 soluble lytic murein transglycosylase-like protein [Sphingomonas naasensis]TGX38279.1 lytic transglycosylase domain-containing protein [Sphingomonas naasensis]